MVKRFVLIIVAITLLLSGCAQLQTYKPTVSQTAATQTSVVPSPSQSQLLSEPSPSASTTADPGTKMLFTSTDTAKIRSFWPFKKCGIDNFGKFNFASIDQSGASLYISFGFDTDKDFKSVYKEINGYFKGKWKKEGEYQYEFIGKAEGREIYCGTIETGGLCTIIMYIPINEANGEAVKLMDSHWLSDQLNLPHSLMYPSKREAQIEQDHGTNITYTWKITNYDEVFNWFGDVMEKSGYKRPEDNGKDLSVGFDVGSSYALINLSKKSKTVIIRSSSSEAAEF